MLQCCQESLGVPSLCHEVSTVCLLLFRLAKKIKTVICKHDLYRNKNSPEFLLQNIMHDSTIAITKYRGKMHCLFL